MLIFKIKKRRIKIKKIFDFHSVTKFYYLLLQADKIRQKKIDEK